MRMLWAKVGGLWPPHSGGRLRSLNLLRELSRDHAVTVVTTYDPASDGGVLRLRLPDCREVIEVPHRPVKHGDPNFIGLLVRSWLRGTPVDMLRWRSPLFASEVRTQLREGSFDVCVADFLSAAPNVPLDGTCVPVVLFEHNVEHMIWKRLAGTAGVHPRRLALEPEWRRLRRYEARACAAAARTIAVSDADREQLQRLAPSGAVFSVPTGVDVTYFQPRPDVEERKEVVFVGSMDWYPNEDGMRWFIDSVLPALKAEVPDVTVTVVGRRPSPRFSRMANAHGVHVTGTVDDVRGYLARAAVCLVPLRVGGGTRLKIFEALGMGKATVATSIGAEGLPVANGRELVVADEPRAFAREVAALLGDAERRRRLGEAGRRLVEERYAWSRVAREFAGLCEGAATRVDLAASNAAPGRVHATG